MYFMINEGSSFNTFPRILRFIYLSCTAVVVVLFKDISRPTSVVVMGNFAFLYLMGIVYFISLISWLCFRTSIVTVSQLMGSRNFPPALPNSWSFGYISEALLAIIDVSSENLRASLVAVAFLLYSYMGFGILV